MGQVAEAQGPNVKSKRTLLATAAVALAIAAGAIIYLQAREPDPEGLPYPFDAEEAQRRQQAEAERLGVPVQDVLSLGGGLTVKLVLIPAGNFLMGSSETEEFGYCYGERPQHKVAITKPFYMGATEVTQAQWRAVMGREPWKGRDNVRETPENAASYINWHDAVKFCRKLSRTAGKTVRLPTEAEWEYACRAGSAGWFHYGDDPDCSRLGEYAWYNDNAYSRRETYPHAVGQKKPNAWGLYDMHGNVYEWCHDWYDPDFYAEADTVDPRNTTIQSIFHVLRSSTWQSSALCCRSALRAWRADHASSDGIGFRVVVSWDGEN